MGKINKPTIDRKVYDDRYEYINIKTKKVVKVKPIPLNVQKYKKYVKETGDLGV